MVRPPDSDLFSQAEGAAPQGVPKASELIAGRWSGFKGLAPSTAPSLNFPHVAQWGFPYCSILRAAGGFISGLFMQFQADCVLPVSG